MNLADLDQRVLTAVSTYLAQGCSGMCEADDDNVDTVFVFAGDVTDRLADLEATWQQLWPTFGQVSDETRELLTQLGHPPLPDPGPEPVWDEHWVGTRGEYLTAASAWRTAQKAVAADAEELLRSARAALLRDAGATLVEAWVPTGRVWVHDLGCRCGHTTDSHGDGAARLHVRGDAVYLTPLDTDLDAVLADGEAARTASIAATEARNHQLLDELLEDDVPLDRNGADELDLTYADWVARRQQRRTENRATLEQARAAGDWETLRHLAPRLRHLRATERLGASAAASVLTGRRVHRLTDDEAQALAAVLLP